MAAKNKKDLIYAETPESVGVDSKEIQALCDDFIEHGQEIHSLMVIRHGKVACEVYREPFNPDSRHMMYSISKSFCSCAVGFCIDEGLLSMETTFLEVFPERKPKKPDEYLEKLNVYHLLTMRSGKNVSVMLDRTKDQWMDDFLNSPWGSEPGTEFLYISENMYILNCMVQKVTGMTVMDYLMPRLFEPLGIEEPFWETCPGGVEAGGWGMMLKTRDLAKFALCIQQGGKWAGKQVLPAWWVAEIGKPHADNREHGDNIDCVEGYGLCFWRCGGYKNCFRMDGMYSQYAFIFEDIDACIITTAGEVWQTHFRDTVWRHVPKCFIDDDPDAKPEKITLKPFEKLRVTPRSFLENKIEGRKITFSKQVLHNVLGYPTSIIPLPAVYMEKDKAGNINDVTLRFLEKEALLTWTEGDEVNTVHIGMDGEYRWDEIVLGQIKYQTCSHGAWLAEDELEIRIRPIEVVSERRLIFKFSGEKVTMRTACVPALDQMCDNLKDSFKSVMKASVVQSVADLVFPYIPAIVEFPFYGKFVDSSK